MSNQLCQVMYYIMAGKSPNRLSNLAYITNLRHTQVTRCSVPKTASTGDRQRRQARPITILNFSC